MTDTDFIVDQLTAVFPDGTRSLVEVRIGKPFKDDPASYKCIIEATGAGRAIGIGGESPMQALHLGLKMLRVQLELFEKDHGVRFVCPDTGETDDWRRYWFGEGRFEAG
jgi:hypothetical protein